MSKKTKFKQMLKNIDNIYIYVGFHEKTYKVKIDRNHKEHRLLLTSKKYSKRWDEIIEKNNWSTTPFGDYNDLYIGSSKEPFIKSKSDESYKK
jgi:hypothetical protein